MLDPCTFFWPKYTWIIPTEDEAEMLFYVPGISFEDKTELTRDYVEFYTYTNSIQFYANGYYHNRDAFKGSQFTSTYAFFWTSTEFGVIGDYRHYIYFMVSCTGD